MFCPNCGRDCGEAIYCSNCGHRLQYETDQTSFAERKKTLQSSGQVYCPKCLSTGITVLERRNRYIYSPFGGLFWLIRERMNAQREKRDGMECVCMKCDYRWYTKLQAMREQYAKDMSQLQKMYPVSLESYIVLDEVGITLGHYGKVENLIPYEEIAAIEYRKGVGPLKGRLSVRDRGNRKRRFPRTLEEAKRDNLTVFYNEYWTNEVYQIYYSIRKIIEKNKKAGMF